MFFELAMRKFPLLFCKVERVVKNTVTECILGPLKIFPPQGVSGVPQDPGLGLGQDQAGGVPRPHPGGGVQRSQAGQSPG